jgi:hypothetical protein
MLRTRVADLFGPVPVFGRAKGKLNTRLDCNTMGLGADWPESFYLSEIGRRSIADNTSFFWRDERPRPGSQKILLIRSSNAVVLFRLQRW